MVRRSWEHTGCKSMCSRHPGSCCTHLPKMCRLAPSAVLAAPCIGLPVRASLSIARGFRSSHSSRFDAAKTNCCTLGFVGGRLTAVTSHMKMLAAACDLVPELATRARSRVNKVPSGARMTACRFSWQCTCAGCERLTVHVHSGGSKGCAR
jgi:hypothetical protein